MALVLERISGASENSEGKLIIIPKDGKDLGRGPQYGVPKDEVKVSRKHCHVSLTDNGLNVLLYCIKKVWTQRHGQTDLLENQPGHKVQVNLTQICISYGLYALWFCFGGSAHLYLPCCICKTVSAMLHSERLTNGKIKGIAAEIIPSSVHQTLPGHSIFMLRHFQLNAAKRVSHWLSRYCNGYGVYKCSC